MSPNARRPGRPISAEALVPGSPEEVFAFLADLQNHWLLAGPFIEVVDLEGPEEAHVGGRVRIHGPLGLRRTAATRVEGATPPSLIFGTAEVGRRTAARVEWSLSADGSEASRVRLQASVLRAGALDRLVLALGGRRWLAWHFRTTLAALVGRFAP